MPIYKRRAKQADIRVGDLMAAPPMVVSERSTIDGAAKAMWEKKVGSVLVVNGAGRLLGIVTERDVIFAVARSMTGKRAPVSGIMSKNMISSHPDESVSAAIEKMRQANIRHLPIMDESGKPVGMLSLRDVLDVGASFVKIIMQSE